MVNKKLTIVSDQKTCPALMSLFN